jgi:hypothetical protein
MSFHSYAVGDCATIEQPKLLENLAHLFQACPPSERCSQRGGSFLTMRRIQEADRTTTGGVTVEALRDLIEKKSSQFPQVRRL